MVFAISCYTESRLLFLGGYQHTTLPYFSLCLKDFLFFLISILIDLNKDTLVSLLFSVNHKIMQFTVNSSVIKIKWNYKNYLPYHSCIFLMNTNWEITNSFFSLILSCWSSHTAIQHNFLSPYMCHLIKKWIWSVMKTEWIRQNMYYKFVTKYSLIF